MRADGTSSCDRKCSPHLCTLSRAEEKLKLYVAGDGCLYRQKLTSFGRQTYPAQAEKSAGQAGPSLTTVRACSGPYEHRTQSRAFSQKPVCQNLMLAWEEGCKSGMRGSLSIGVFLYFWSSTFIVTAPIALPGTQQFPNNREASALTRSRVESTYLLPFTRSFPRLLTVLQSFTHSVEVHRHLGRHDFSDCHFSD